MKALRLEHPNTLSNTANLVVTNFKQERCDTAEKLGMQVKEVSLRVPSAEHPSTLRNMENLATTYLNQER